MRALAWTWLITLSPTVVLASGGATQPQAQSAQPSAVAAAPKPKLTPEQVAKLVERKQIIREHLEGRLKGLRGRAHFFEKIAQQKDYSAEYVLKRDTHTTTFLDRGDPLHPNFQAGNEEARDSAQAANPNRTHLLVIPNVKREHVAATFGAQITPEDIAEVGKVMKSARRTVKQLGIKNARIFANSPENASVGYFHVHIIGERDPQRPYPRAKRGLPAAPPAQAAPSATEPGAQQK